jgi:hypothetical protein
MSFSFDESKEEILKKLNNAQGVPQTIQIGLAFLNFKLQEELLEKQNIYNNKQLFWSRMLAVGTWALVLVTLLLVKWG